MGIIITNHYIGFDINFDTPKRVICETSFFQVDSPHCPLHWINSPRGTMTLGKVTILSICNRTFSEMAINNQWLVDRMRIKSTFTNRVASSSAHSTYKSSIGISTWLVDPKNKVQLSHLYSPPTGLWTNRDQIQVRNRGSIDISGNLTWIG